MHGQEALMQMPIADFRKVVIGLLLAPFLVNIKLMPIDVAERKIREWRV
jgi:hypothetical protein